jgi:hypothetical protein
MNSSEYIPLNTKIYIKKIIQLEAENKALRRTISIYKKLLNKRIFNEHIICERKTPETLGINDNPTVQTNDENVKYDDMIKECCENGYTYNSSCTFPMSEMRNSGTPLNTPNFKDMKNFLKL